MRDLRLFIHYRTNKIDYSAMVAMKMMLLTQLYLKKVFYCITFCYFYAFGTNALKAFVFNIFFNRFCLSFRAFIENHKCQRNFMKDDECYR